MLPLADENLNAVNPYEAPMSEFQAADPFQDDDISVRRQFIDCEANIRSIGGVTVFGGLLLMILSVVFAYATLGSGSGPLSVFALVACCGVCLLAVSHVAIGIGLQRFRTWARIGAIALCVLWLPFIPIGTIFGGTSLWYLVRPAAKYVFTPTYKQIIHRTPHVYFRTSSTSWGLLFLVLIGGGAFIAYLTISR